MELNVVHLTKVLLTTRTWAANIHVNKDHGNNLILSLKVSTAKFLFIYHTCTIS